MISIVTSGGVCISDFDASLYTNESSVIGSLIYGDTAMTGSTKHKINKTINRRFIQHLSFAGIPRRFHIRASYASILVLPVLIIV